MLTTARSWLPSIGAAVMTSRTSPPFAQPPPITRPPAPRLLAGGGSRTPTGAHAAPAGRRSDDSFPATLPFDRSVARAGSEPPAVPSGPPAAQRPGPSQDALPRWAKGVVIGGVLLAVAMPASVLLSRSMLVQEALAEQSGSRAAMVCTGGEARARDGTSVTGWLFGGSYFSCGDWETREARVQRERDQAQASYLAREQARQQSR